MTTAAFNLTYDNTSDTTFRTWVSALDTQILAMGWVHATDTGQLNLTTGTRSTTVGANYIIYKTNDGVSPPIYLRMEFYSLTAVTNPGFAFQVGFATDGAGGLTGTAVSGRWVAPIGTSDTTARTCVISGSASRLTLTINMSATTVANSVHLAVERNKTTAGVDTNTGAILAFIVGSAGAAIAGTASKRAGFLFLPTTGGVPAIEFLLPVILTNNASAANTFGTITGAGVPVPLAGVPQPPGLNHLVCLTAEAPARDTTVSITTYDGSAHTYYHIGPNFTAFVGCGGTVTATAHFLLQRYE